MNLLTVQSASPAQTEAIGAAIGEIAEPGWVIALSGALGAGKTQFVKGLARGLGVAPAEPVVSPTFVLLREYAGRLRLFHFDLYRLSDPDELFLLGFEEIRAHANAVIAMEWPERAAALLPADHVRVDLTHRGGDSRELKIAAPPAALKHLRTALATDRLSVTT